MNSPEIVMLCALLAAAVWFDLTGHRIPNALVFGGALAGAALMLHASPSLATLTDAALGWATGLVLLLPVYAFGKIGAGDVKLLAMIGLFIGPMAVLWATLWSLIFGGAIAIVTALMRRGPRNLLWDLAGANRDTSAMRATMPYGLALALGTLFVVLRATP